MNDHSWVIQDHLLPKEVRRGFSILPESQAEPASQECDLCKCTRLWVQKGPPHVLCSAVAVLKFLIISKQGPLHFQFIQGTASLVADPDHIEWMVREEKGEQEAIFLPKQGQRILESPKLWTLCTSTLSNAAICSTPHEIDYEFLEGRYNTLFSPVYSLKWCLAFSFN